MDKEYNEYLWSPKQPRVYDISPLRISGTPMSEEDATMSLRAENLQQSLQQNPIFKSTKQWAAQQEQRKKEIAASKKWLELHPEDNNDDPYTIFERGKHQAIVDGKDPSYYEKMINDGKKFTKGALTVLSLPYLGAAAAGAYGYGASLGARGLFAGQGIYGLANKDGVRKTVNLIKSGNYGRAALSGAGDVLNAAMVIPEARFLGNVAKYGTKSAIAGDMLNQSVRSNVPNFNKPLVKYYGPTMGKTTAKSEKLIDFDDIMRPIKESLAKDLGITREELVKSGHPALQQAYADQINLWRNNSANNGKILMVSSAGTLDPKYKITFDNYPTLPERSNFIRRNVKRGGTEEEAIAWYDDLVQRFPFHIDNRFVSEIESTPKSNGLLRISAIRNGEKYVLPTSAKTVAPALISKQISKTKLPIVEPALNIGWGPKQTLKVSRAGEYDQMYFPERWDVVNEGANPHGVWLQGKYGTPRTDLTNPGKGAKAARARNLFSTRSDKYTGTVTLDKPMVTVGEVPNRSSLSYQADNMGADGLIYNGVYDNGYNNNQVILSFRRPELTKIQLSKAERLGIPKGDRGNLSQDQLNALEDLTSYMQSFKRPKLTKTQLPEAERLDVPKDLSPNISRSLGFSSTTGEELFMPNEILGEFVSGKNQAAKFFQQPVVQNSYAHNKELANRLGINIADRPENISEIVGAPIKLSPYIQNPGNELANIAQSYLGDPSATLSIAWTPFSKRVAKLTGIHEGLHRGHYAQVIKPAPPITKNYYETIMRPEATFWNWKINKLLKPEYQNGYLGGPFDGEAGVNLIEMGRDMGVKLGTKYPGDEVFMNMINNYNGHKSFLIPHLNLDTRAGRRHVWDAMTGQYFKQGGILKRVEKAQNGTSIKGKYLGKDYRDYYAYFKSYDNFINSQSYKNITDPKQKILAKNMARYYYNTNPELNDFWELAYHTIPEYNKKMAQYKYNDKYIIDMGEPSYRLKSLDVNGKPTNKHTLKMHQNVLDYIYNEAIRGGVDPKTAISIATQESNLGVARQKDSKINAFDLFSYWNGIGDSIYTNAQIVDTYNDLYKKITSDQQLSPKDLQNIQLLKERYNKMNSSIHEYNGDNVVADAVKYFNTGKYNPGDPNYIDTVNSRFSELMNDDRFANWWNSKQQLKFGGIIKRK